MRTESAICSFRSQCRTDCTVGAEEHLTATGQMNSNMIKNLRFMAEMAAFSVAMIVLYIPALVLGLADETFPKWFERCVAYFKNRLNPYRETLASKIILNQAFPQVACVVVAVTALVILLVFVAHAAPASGC